MANEFLIQWQSDDDQLPYIDSYGNCDMSELSADGLPKHLIAHCGVIELRIRKEKGEEHPKFQDLPIPSLEELL